MYRINNPVADWHSWRQADTASVTREYVNKGINLFYPTYHDLSNIPSGKDNLSGWRMVEFPIVNAFTAGIILLGNLQQQEVLVGRLVSVFFSIMALLGIYYVGKELSGKKVGFMAATLFAVLPFSIYYSRVILPEPALLAFISLSLCCFAHWTRFGKNISLFFSLIFFSLALLLKPFALLYAPMFLGFVLVKKGYDLRSFGKLMWFFAISAVPLVLWRSWIKQFPEGIPASDWLYNQNNIRFTGAFFHWIFEVRIATLMLGIGGAVFAVMGFLKKGKDWLVYMLGLVGVVGYVFIIAGGNVQHDYYQVILLPFLVLLMARGIVFFFDLTPKYIARNVAWPVTAGLLFFSIFVSWYYVRGYFNVNRWELVEAGKAIDAIVPKDAKIIAPYMGDTAFLFQTKRSGWPIGFDIENKISQGAEYYVSVNYDDEAN